MHEEYTHTSHTLQGTQTHWPQPQLCVLTSQAYSKSELATYTGISALYFK